MDNELKESRDFRQVIKLFNIELKSKGIYDCEYLLINNSIEEVFHVLEDNCECYSLVKDERYSNDITFSSVLETYFEKVKEYYQTIMIKEGSTDTIADRYFRKITEPVKKDGEFIIYDKSNIELSGTDVLKTMELMREAIIAYYKVYDNKELIAELTTTDPEINDEIVFRIKEEQLLHLLGVSIKQLNSNPEFARLTGKSNMRWDEVLDWIMKDIDGNNDLAQYQDDWLKRIKNSNGKNVVSHQYRPDINSQLLNFGKIRSKSQTFLKYGPMEAVSMVAKLKDGKTLSKYSKSNMAMISRAESFRKYPWAYFGQVQGRNGNYMETLQIDTSDNKKELFMGSKPAIVKSVQPVSDDGSDGSGTGTMPAIFSEEEQMDLFIQAYEEFSDVMDFTNLIEYFNNLNDSLNKSRTKRTSK